MTTDNLFLGSNLIVSKYRKSVYLYLIKRVVNHAVELRQWYISFYAWDWSLLSSNTSLKTQTSVETVKVGQS
ncbi:hypothetical protein T03_6122 [Trichinella britovi]|uniref:Uncharacterized protein n=1 Tax=Trichinella britovi TaxID=45882 RepID=A0A0V0ZBP9_TRIBR|nr:hypothetical protein T03_6122 [Trichinella britovi]